MNSKQLVKVIKTIVEAEVAKKHEKFLTKTFPKILEEEVSRRMKTLSEEKGGVVDSSTTLVEEVDPFQMAEQVLEEERQQPKKQFTTNSVLNEVLNSTKPFTKEQRQGGVGGGTSVLDNLPQQNIQESMDKTVTFTEQGAGAGLEGMRASMAAQMGYGNMNQSTVRKTGLGVKTGLPGLDRILNRDNSELVKKFKK